MARIRDEDVAVLRERARIDEVVRDYVTLKNAGGGSMKGLCPFHEERSPSFHVTPAKGLYHCFSCQEGGDVISFVRKIDNLSFAEAIEKLAAKYGMQLRYDEGGVRPDRDKGQRTRLVEAHKVSAAFYRANLSSPDAAVAREFLLARGFDEQSWETFGVGFAPKGWDSLTSHLRKAGFEDRELLAAGLLVQGQRGVYDRFRGRLVWPIRELAGEVVGFGARKLFDDDEGPKYLNTPETPIYKKSNVLYGLDLARRDISKKQQVVIVEGYTDVMAAHLSGVTTAVATCGTAFGTDHIKVIRRLLLDAADSGAEVIFTFDGDAAGQKAAMRAFVDDQKFVSQTFVAVDPHGLDPCDLRIQHGPEAVQALVKQRVPMFEFAIRSTLVGYDLDTAEGRVAALRATAPMVAAIRDTSLRPEYARQLAGWIGLDVEAVRSAVATASRAPKAAPERRFVTASDGGEPQQEPKAIIAPPNPRDPAILVERELLSCVLQHPHLVGEWYSSVEATAFTWGGHRAVHEALVRTGGPMAAGDEQEWIQEILESCTDDRERTVVRDLVLRPLPVDVPDIRYATSLVARLLEMDAARQITELRSRLQRAESSGEGATEALERLLALEQYRRDLRTQVFGDQ
jgi:DNA primase